MYKFSKIFMTHFMLNSQEINAQQQQQRYIHIGNLHKICGPYYSNPQPFFFGFTFLLSLFICGTLLKFVFVRSPHSYIGLFLCLYFMYRYLSLAFSDPGMSRNRQQPLQNPQQIRNFCRSCVLPMKKRTVHCDICDVCVDGYDHHCVFIGKCIAKGNMGQFKQFLLIVFATMIYALILSFQIQGTVKKVG